MRTFSFLTVPYSGVVKLHAMIVLNSKSCSLLSSPSIDTAGGGHLTHWSSLLHAPVIWDVDTLTLASFIVLSLSCHISWQKKKCGSTRFELISGELVNILIISFSFFWCASSGVLCPKQFVSQIQCVTAIGLGWAQVMLNSKRIMACLHSLTFPLRNEVNCHDG